MKSIRDYVNEMFNEIPDSEQKDIMKQEIIQNLEEKVCDLMEQGKAEEDAINKAIIDFGSIEDIKKELIGKQPGVKNNAGLHLGYSIWGSALIIALSVFMNFYYTPRVIWFVYPTFAVLWWPLSMYFRWLKLK
ncbi:MAG: permease prefix domain 1-containing protein [Clostridia bacterium]|nr:permease prefix domain 1-containing protein [Clostridia bacterium]